MTICKLGEDVLRTKCEPVSRNEINDDMRHVFEEMFKAMDDEEGVGLAGPQVGIAKRMFVVRADDSVRRVFINPQIVSTSEELSDYEEGCLSIPGVYETIKRPARIKVNALNERGKPFTIEAEGLLARVVQHENDHLDGILFIDRGDKEFAKKTAAAFKKRAARAAKKQAAKAAKAHAIENKKAARDARKQYNQETQQC